MSRFHFRLPLLVLGALAALSAPSASAQNDQARANAAIVAAQRSIDARREAYDAFKNGNPTAALARLAAKNASNANARDADLELADDLAFIACQFASENEAAHARDVAGLAIAKLQVARGRVTPREAVQGLALSGELTDHVLRDSRQAIALYEQVMAADPSAPQVAERLAHLKAVEKRAAEKTAANELLRRRAQADKR